MTTVPNAQLWTDTLHFGEGPRYRDGRLYVSDQHAKEVVALHMPDAADRTPGMQAQCEVVTKVPAGPSGLGWLPDGTLLVVSMHDRKLLALRQGRLSLHADLNHIATWHCNDMVVDAQGRAYVGNFGFDLDADAPPAPARLALVHPDGRTQTVAEDLLFPNGMVILPGGKTLVVGETFGSTLTAFDIATDGSLSNRRVWADLPNPPDGICLDAEGCIWVAHPTPMGGFSRVREGGHIEAHLDPEPGYLGIACMLGGPERRSLFMVEARSYKPHETSAGNSRVRMVAVDVPGAGHP